MFDYWTRLLVVDDRYLNAQPAPAISPQARFESIPVIARLVNLDGSETWAPAVAVRWTPTVVLVAVGGTAAVHVFLGPARSSPVTEHDGSAGHHRRGHHGKTT